MEDSFKTQVQGLYAKAEIIVNDYFTAKRKNSNKANPKEEGSEPIIPQEFKEEFFRLVDKVNLSLLDDKDNFYGYFLLQMSREIRFDISSPTAVNFRGAKYVIYFNPLIFLMLNLKQMESTLKHEILHIVSLHLSRAKEFRGSCSTLAINLAMNIVVNAYLDHLPPYAVTLEWVNLKYSLNLLPFKPFEYYAEEIQAALDLLEADEVEGRDTAEFDDSKNDVAEDVRDNEAANSNSDPDDGDYGDPDKADETDNANALSNGDGTIAINYAPEKAHDIWEDSSEVDEKTLREFTEKFIENAQKGGLPNYLASLISALKSSGGELPWNLYLKRLMGSVESDKKKTVTRRDRRQPERLDLRGQLRSHKAKIVVALDISGSISDQEFNQAMREVLAIVKNYNHEIRIVECDSEIRREYKVKSATDIKARLKIRGGTRFTPVFEYANQNKVNLLIYFTDGKGEERLQTTPRGYKTLWVISGGGDELSLNQSYGAVKKLKALETNDESLIMSDVKRDGYSMNDQESMHI